MNSTAWRGIKLAAVVFIAAVLQAAFADAVKIGGARPDLLLTISLVGAMFCGEGAAAALGFFAALLHASLAAPPHAGAGSILVSRTLVCFGVGWMEDRMYRDSVVVALVVVVLGTLAVEFLYFLFYPQHNVLTWARIVALAVVGNGLLAAPSFYAIRGLLGRHRVGGRR